MNPEYLTPGAERAIAAARGLAGGAACGLAHRSDENEVSIRHLALGLFAEEEGPAISLAARCGFNAGKWRESQPNALGLDVEKLHPAVEKTLRDARSLAREYLVDRTVNCDLLLLCVCRNGPDLVSEWTTLGFLFEALERIVLQPLQELVPLAEQPERIHTEVWRILDANADRAREAIRVMEDYCRFALNDGILSAALKQLRHDLAEALPPQTRLTVSGDTINDVGTLNTTKSEYRRESLAGVATANAKRLQEALRSLEEFGKLIDPNVGRACEKLRYRAYTLEQALLFGQQARQRLADTRLCLLVSARPQLKHLIEEAIAGGVDMVQLREKKLGDRQLLELAKQVRQWTRDAKTLFIVNDRPEIAKLCDADGVHLGQDDLPVAFTRRIVGPESIIGVSTHNLDQLNRAVIEGASYVGIGPTFASSTKSFDQLAGLDFVRAASAATDLPAFALGGINCENVNQVVFAGAKGIAVSAAIADSGNPRQDARLLRDAITRNSLPRV